MNGQYKIAEQKGGKAIFAFISLSVVSGSGETTVVKLPDVPEPNPVLIKLGKQDSFRAKLIQYYDEIRAGAGSAIADLAAAEIISGNAYLITINDFEWNPIDTSSDAVFFTAYQAVMNSFGHPLVSSNNFDRETMSFSLIRK